MQAPTRTKTVINLKTAKCSVSTCRPPLRVRADETIE